MLISVEITTISLGSNFTKPRDKISVGFIKIILEGNLREIFFDSKKFSFLGFDPK